MASRPCDDGEIAVAQRPLGHRLVGEMRFQFAPERDSLEQRAGLVEARQAERQRRVHVEVAIDEGRREKVSARVDRLAAPQPSIAGLDRGDAAGRDGDVLSLAAVRQRGVANNQIEGHVTLRFVRQTSGPFGARLRRARAAQSSPCSSRSLPQNTSPSPATIDGAPTMPISAAAGALGLESRLVGVAFGPLERSLGIDAASSEQGRERGPIGDRQPLAEFGGVDLAGKACALLALKRQCDPRGEQARLEETASAA